MAMCQTNRTDVTRQDAMDSRERHRRAGSREATREAIRKLSDKRVPAAYQSPRGNGEAEPEELDRSVEAFLTVLGR